MTEVGSHSNQKLRPTTRYNHPVPPKRQHVPTQPLPIRAAAAFLIIAAAATPQTLTPTIRKPRPPQPPFNPNIIFLDPAHGGSDPGATLEGNTPEKDATLAFAKLLRTLLTPQGFTVILTHESAAIPQPPPPPQPDEDGNIPPATPFNPAANNPPLDTRVEQANRSHAVACLLIHASNGGHGVHLYTSSLTPAPPPDPALDPALRPIPLWDTAQAPTLPQSTQLASDLATAINGIRIPLITAHTSVRPIDSMTCPALALELSPLPSGDSPADPAYQQRVAQAIAVGLVSWRTRAQTQLAAAQAARDAAAQTALPTTVPKPKTKPKPIAIPQENPVTLTPDSNTSPRKPAPIVRRPPEITPPGDHP